MQKLLYVVIAVGIVIALRLPCQVPVAQLDAATKQENKMEGILYTSQGQWKRSSPLYLMFFILNDTNKRIRFDGRMSWPGSITLYVSQPNGETIRASRLTVRMADLVQEDVVTLDSDRLYGVRLLIDPTHDARLAKELRNAHRGRYIFWVEYYGHPAAQWKCVEVSVKSNSVTVVVP